MTVEELERAVRRLQEDDIALKDENRRLRQDLDVLRSGRLGTLGFRKTALVGDNALNTAKYQDGSVTPAKLSDGISRAKLEATESETITVESGAGYSFPQFQITELGVQILADDTSAEPPLFLLILPEYVADLGYNGGTPFPDVDFWSGITGNADNTDNRIELVARNYTGNETDWSAQVQAYADQSNAFAMLRAQRDGGAFATLEAIAVPTATSSHGRVRLDDTILWLASLTSDPTGTSLTDRALWYRSDTDKIRARVNGATVNLLTSADSVFSWSLSTTAGDYNTTMVTGEVLVYTGTGGHTLTMNASANAFLIGVKNSGTGIFTLDPSGAETIDGAASLVLAPGDSVFLFGALGNWVIV